MSDAVVSGQRDSGPSDLDASSITVYADFNCPYSYLASLLVNDLVDRGAVTVDWRAVEHDRRLSVSGEPAGSEDDRWRREIREAQQLPLAGEQRVWSTPAMVSNTRAAVTA